MVVVAAPQDEPAASRRNADLHELIAAHAGFDVILDVASAHLSARSDDAVEAAALTDRSRPISISSRATDGEEKPRQAGRGRG